LEFICAASDAPLPKHQRHIVRKPGRLRLTRAQLHGCTLVANHLVLDAIDAAVPYKAMSSPIRDETRRVAGSAASGGCWKTWCAGAASNPGRSAAHFPRKRQAHTSWPRTSRPLRSARAAQLGVDYSQGFFIGKPLALDDVIRDLPL
jgi:hypothetical protein